MSVREIILLIVSVAILAFLLIKYRRWESKRMKQKAYETMSPTLRREIDEERRQGMEKQKKFEEAMKKAGGSPP